jgi:hypothetical protein
MGVGVSNVTLAVEGSWPWRGAFIPTYGLNQAVIPGLESKGLNSRGFIPGKPPGSGGVHAFRQPRTGWEG